MVFDKRSYDVLVASSFAKASSLILSLLPPSSTCRVVTDISAAKRASLEQSYDLIIINSPLPDDPGAAFAVDVCTGKSASVLLCVRAEIYEEVKGEVSEHGVFTLPKPISAQTLHLALDWMICSRERMRRIEKKAVSVDDKMAEIRTVNRAKWLLIDNLKMTEPDAHRYIEKQAMDRCVTRREIAEGIIRTYT